MSRKPPPLQVIRWRWTVARQRQHLTRRQSAVKVGRLISRKWPTFTERVAALGLLVTFYGSLGLAIWVLS